MIKKIAYGITLIIFLIVVGLGFLIYERKSKNNNPQKVFDAQRPEYTDASPESIFSNELEKIPY